MGLTTSHQFAIEAAGFGGGQAAARRLRLANVLTCGIGLPIAEVDGDMNGLRFGTPEIVRWGMTEEDMPELAGADRPRAARQRTARRRRRRGHRLPPPLRPAAFHQAVMKVSQNPIHGCGMQRLIAAFCGSLPEVIWRRGQCRKSGGTAPTAALWRTRQE